jgi:hypothetical protein
MKKASNNSGVKQGLSVHVIVEKRLHIITFGTKSHSAGFVAIFFFCNSEPANLLQFNDRYE